MPCFLLDSWRSHCNSADKWIDDPIVSVRALWFAESVVICLVAPNRKKPSLGLLCHVTCWFPLPCLWKRRQVVLDLLWFEARWDLWLPTHPMPAINQVRTSLPPPRDMPPPLNMPHPTDVPPLNMLPPHWTCMLLHWCAPQLKRQPYLVVHSGSEVFTWPLWPNLWLTLSPHFLRPMNEIVSSIDTPNNPPPPEKNCCRMGSNTQALLANLDKIIFSKGDCQFSCSPDKYIFSHVNTSGARYVARIMLVSCLGHTSEEEKHKRKIAETQWMYKWLFTVLCVHRDKKNWTSLAQELVQAGCEQSTSPALIQRCFSAAVPEKQWMKKELCDLPPPRGTLVLSQRCQLPHVRSSSWQARNRHNWFVLFPNSTVKMKFPGKSTRNLSWSMTQNHLPKEHTWTYWRSGWISLSIPLRILTDIQTIASSWRKNKKLIINLGENIRDPAARQERVKFKIGNWKKILLGMLLTCTRK